MLLFLNNLWHLWLLAAPWLLLGLAVAGLMKAWLPADRLRRWMGRGVGSIGRAAIIGTPLPLCSCSVLPAALQLRRSGASRGATVSFLISTPENGADSIALSYAMLGPFMAIVRPVAALFSALVAGLATESLNSHEDAEPTESASKSCCHAHDDEERVSWWGGLTYSMTRLLSDLLFWLIVGISLAALIQTVLPADAMQRWGSGIWAMLAMLAIGIPMYICATSSTPVAAAMLAVGVSPGTTLVFLLAGPATNLAGLFLVGRELGRSAVVGYLLGICGMSLVCGLAVDWIVQSWSINVVAQVHAHDMHPNVWNISCAVLLIALALRAVIVTRLKGSPPTSTEPEPVEQPEPVQLQSIELPTAETVTRASS